MSAYEHHDTVVIGGGQAGLAMSYHLRQAGREHIVLERRRIGERWFSERWDSLRFQFPNWSVQLPGFAYQGGDPEGFAHYTEIGQFVQDYARFIEAPVRCGTEVVALRRDQERGHFLIDLGASTIAASRVVIATGPFQRPVRPEWATSLPARIFQVHAGRYQNPEQLPSGAVLVVGTGASGCQIAEELLQSGRTVYLSISRHRRAPRRFGDRDLLWWLLDMGRMDTPIDSFPGRRMPPSLVITGADGGHDVNVRDLAADGAIILGRSLGCSDGKLSFGSDAEQILAEADNTYEDFIRAAVDHARTRGMAGLPDSTSGERAHSGPVPVIPTLDLKAANITSVVWATGYGFDFDWVRLPVIGERGAPLQRRGLTDVPNVYFLGLHWMHTFKSGVLFGVGEDAAYIASSIERAEHERGAR